MLRNVTQLISGTPSSDGAGVRLTRMIGGRELNHLDPFLLFDVFDSDESADYIGGFPPHPHRGFATLTWMLEGRMRHRDNAGNEGLIETGGVQWMNAGRGIVHSEMPEQESGRMRGVQLWVNLPARSKFSAPFYVDVPGSALNAELHPGGVTVRPLVGRTAKGMHAAVDTRHIQPVVLEVIFPAGTEWVHEMPHDHNGLLWVAEGAIDVQGVTVSETVARGQLGILGDGDRVELHAADGPARILLANAARIGEPIARGGPFVMNTREEVLQAFDDFSSGALGGDYFMPGKQRSKD